jgi:ABC-type multidrug transport system permease subunit
MSQSFFDTQIRTNFGDWFASSQIQQSAEREQRESYFQKIKQTLFIISGLFLITFIFIILAKKPNE